MTQNNTLNNYLDRLEKSLGQISVSDRAEIILEIKSHIDEAQEAGGNLDEILSSLGEAETVANRYLLERGLATHKAPKHPIVKWLMIGFLGTFGIACLSLIVLISQFTPLIKVDEKEGRVQILGGLIDVQEKGGKFKIGDTVIEHDQENFEFKGSLPVNSKQKVSMNFNNVKADLATSSDELFHWDCKLDEESQNKPVVASSDTEIVFDLGEVKGASCKIEIPSQSQSKFIGKNGKVTYIEPKFGVDLELNNGKVSFSLDKNKGYVSDFSITNGTKPENLYSNDKLGAVHLQAKVTNGKISVDWL